MILGLITLFGVSKAFTTPIQKSPNSFRLYDNFNQEVLDVLKWVESTSSMFHDEHFVSKIETAYHTAQLNEADKETVLLFKDLQFSSGDKVKYDLNYSSGSGNRIHIIDLDNNYRWLGQLGYWNGIEPGGNDFGVYHILVEFDSLGANVTITRPDGTSLIRRLDSPNEQHTLGFGTRTGHNGLVHIDYDDVYINSVPGSSTQALWNKVINVKKFRW